MYVVSKRRPWRSWDDCDQCHAESIAKVLADEQADDLAAEAETRNQVIEDIRALLDTLDISQLEHVSSFLAGLTAR